MTEHHLAEVRHLVRGGHGGKRKASGIVVVVAGCVLLGAAATLVGAAASLLVEGAAARLAVWAFAAMAAAVSMGLWWGSAEFRQDHRPRPWARDAGQEPRHGGRR
ncbi:hypothetical protein GCM10009837_32370 [Streptomyces durmitorensis]|uniref:Integral membrane protein n=1 Tax=Streptomyces durmitorensis TaxID=319947 RepID=A0ABY4Q1B3_9ACTN|nr:hypothetical protein [Streptomyces durmitorensis]UQT59354.1 hypothetical protein M4V62_32200 [Streptomyces durmitorensis]